MTFWKPLQFVRRLRNRWLILYRGISHACITLMGGNPGGWGDIFPPTFWPGAMTNVIIPPLFWVVVAQNWTFCCILERKISIDTYIWYSLIRLVTTPIRPNRSPPLVNFFSSPTHFRQKSPPLNKAYMYILKKTYLGPMSLFCDF